jgi:hypothetical protein
VRGSCDIIYVLTVIAATVKWYSTLTKRVKDSADKQLLLARYYLVGGQGKLEFEPFANCKVAS